MGGTNDRGNDEQVEPEELPTPGYDGAAVGVGSQIGPYKILRILGEGGYRRYFAFSIALVREWILRREDKHVSH